MTFGSGFFLAAATLGFASCTSSGNIAAGLLLMTMAGVIVTVNETLHRIWRPR